MNFQFYDASIGVRGPNLRPIYHRCLNILRKQGFSVVRDTFFTAFNGYVGECKGLQFNSEIHMRDGVKDTFFKISFWQDFITDNKNGGRWDFGQHLKMPYIIRLRWLKARNAIVAFLESQGFADDTPPDTSDALAYVAYRIRTCGHFRGQDPLADWRPNSVYNQYDRDKKVIEPGQRKCFYDHKGHLMIGTVYYHLNNMWWVVLNGHTVSNVGGFQLFDYVAGIPRRNSGNKLEIWKRELERAVKNQRFERAIVLRDLIRANDESRVAA